MDLSIDRIILISTYSMLYICFCKCILQILTKPAIKAYSLSACLHHDSCSNCLNLGLVHWNSPSRAREKQLKAACHIASIIFFLLVIQRTHMPPELQCCFNRHESYVVICTSLLRSSNSVMITPPSRISTTSKNVP